MATVASATPPTAHVDPRRIPPKHKASNTFKRKRNDDQPEQQSQILQPDTTHPPPTDTKSQDRKVDRSQSRGRQPSLRHVKNSTDILRQKSAKGVNQDSGGDPGSGGRAGRQFTVANVGNNGKIYLRQLYACRPLEKSANQKAQESQSATSQVAAPASTRNTRKADQRTQNTLQSSVWSDTHTSRISTSRARSTGRATQDSTSIARESLRRSRTVSMSTVDGKLDSSGLKATGFKIIIDSANALPKAGEHLQVPIPHYRLGTPRFSTRGTAFLHSSVYTRNSTTEDLTSSAPSGPEYDRLFPVPPGIEAHSPVASNDSQALPQAHTIQIKPVGDNTQTIAVTSSPAFHRIKEPITPSIYDALATNPDDPAIVRYAAGTRDITAASPARIISQITSASFLDYELLSDFFLTVRAYLSTNNLLEYLLARFEWAINKFDDDGRVIRVRAFAALRHWILNYFPYDFVVDRDLRVKFCYRLNALMKEVGQRTNKGPSDLKLILDLKKCWNGRCALYWDGPLLDSEGLDIADIQPGGIAGSRDSELTHPSQLWSKVSGVSPPHIEGVDFEKSTAALNNWFEGIQQAEADAKEDPRHVSVVTTRSLPNSPTSEQSIQALSCTFPGLGLKKGGAYPQRGAVAHPVASPVHASASQRRVCPAAPSALANEEPLEHFNPKHLHKRSGSFSDAVRDKRTSLPSMNVDQPTPHIEASYPYQGSLIRGTVVPPGSPYIDMFAPTSPVSEERNRFFEDSDESDDDEEEYYVEDDEGSYEDESHSNSSSKAAYAPNSSRKNIFGSIRRALSSKQVSQAPLNIGNADASLPSIARSKSSMATSCKSSSKKTGASQRQLDTSRQVARIDLLCADVAEMFQRALMQASEDSTQPSKASTVYQNHMPLVPPGKSLMPIEPSTRNHSGVTNGSRSIPIFDDTRFDEPVPDIPPEFLHSYARSNSLPQKEEYRQGHLTGLAVPSDSPKASPLMRLSNAAAIADRVISAPVIADQSNNAMQPEQDLNFSNPNSTPESGLQTSQVMQHSIIASSNIDSPRSPPSRNPSKSGHRAPRSLRKYASYQSSIHRRDSGRAQSTVTAGGSLSRSSKNTRDAPPGRMLRRRPGGDLRATENVHDLDKVPRRSRSVGSITTCAESLRGSNHTMHRVPRKIPSQNSITPHPPGQEVSNFEPGPKSISLIRTHSSQPALRPSFEAALAQFSRIPDDEGGDIEATLLKLEGKYRKSSTKQNQESNHLPFVKGANQVLREQRAADAKAATQEHGNPKQQELGPVEGVSFPIPPDPQLAPKLLGANGSRVEGDAERRSNMTRSLYATSEESYSSTPVLERGLDGQFDRRETPKAGYLAASVPPPLFSPDNSVANSQGDEVDPDFTGFRRGARCRSSIPTTTDSFLLDEDEFLSDLSSELSDDTIEPDDDIDYPFGSAAQLLRRENRPPKIGYLLGYPTHPPTPPMNQEAAKAITSSNNQSQDSRKPPTPDPSPVSLPVQPSGPKPATSQSFSISTQNLSAHRHVPFIMAFDSVVIAQQFTIIERDALNEINWQDLIDMRWHHNSPSTLNWVDYLRTQEPTGIELVTARFNLMVKWVLSEVVLTQNVEERALAIIKYIHIAKYCRKHHNYASLLQLTIALTSIDISRLAKTWDLVPAAEKRTLRELETLVTPIKNFHNLRQEMETTNSEEGCIPVIALYIHDLTYNSQKPSQVPSTREGEPLVNFERYRTTASIVKSLLRLIDASSKYDYPLVEDALNKSLWMASLSDEMIRLKSKELE
ncbi:MAG: hypothetical protein Q9220_005847 [cf. Caloplaca sp. 1 TL-2023]